MSTATTTIRPGAPGRVLVAALPLGAVLLVAMAARRGGLESGGGEPVPPALMAVVTLMGSLVLSWRAATQVALLDGRELYCRNLISSFRVGWDQIEELRVLRRGGLVVTEVHVIGLRRRLRMGAATRLDGAPGEAVLALVRTRPEAGALLVEESP